jgi:hypothetical protein
MFEEGKANATRHLELNSTEEIRCNALLHRPATYKEFVVTTTGTFNDALSMLEI